MRPRAVHRQRSRLRRGALLLAPTALLVTSGCGPAQDVPMACRGLGTVALPVRLLAGPALVPDGGTAHVDYQVELPARISSFDSIGLNYLRLTIPLPPEVATTDSLSLSGGNVPSSVSRWGNDVVLVVTGPHNVGAVKLPTVGISVTFRTGLAPTEAVWRPPGELRIDSSIGIRETCKPVDAAAALARTRIGSPTPGTTGPQGGASIPAATTTGA